MHCDWKRTMHCVWKIRRSDAHNASSTVTTHHPLHSLVYVCVYIHKTSRSSSLQSRVDAHKASVYSLVQMHTSANASASWWSSRLACFTSRFTFFFIFLASARSFTGSACKVYMGYIQGPPARCTCKVYMRGARARCTVYRLGNSQSSPNCIPIASQLYIISQFYFPFEHQNDPTQININK